MKPRSLSERDVRAPARAPFFPGAVARPRGALLAEPGTCCRGGARGGGTGCSLASGSRRPGGESRAPALRALLLLGLLLPVPGGRGSLGGWAHLVEEQLLWIFFFLSLSLSVGYWQFKAKPLKCITYKVSRFSFMHFSSAPGSLSASRPL